MEGLSKYFWVFCWKTIIRFHNAGFYLGFFVLGGESILKKIFEPRGGEKKFFRPSTGVRGNAPPENFENIVFRIG